MKAPTDPRKLKGRHPCPECGSSDSLGYYEKSAHCYGACDKTFFYDKGEKIDMVEFEEEIGSIEDVSALPFRGSKERDIPLDIYEMYGVRSDIDENGNPASRYYPWYIDGKLTTYKQKTPEKKFYLKGDTKLMHNKKVELFGQHLFSAGGKTLVITEGEDDACAVQRAYMKKYGRPFAAVSDFNSNVGNIISANVGWINTFEKVILWPDQDKAGNEWKTQTAKTIGAGRVHIVDCADYKDANDALRGKGVEYIINRVWNAPLWNPSGFVSGWDLWDRYKTRDEKESLPFPDCLSGIQAKLKGIRLNEITLFTSGTGSGKSTVIKEIIIKIREEKPDAKIGIVSLEEEVGESTEKLIEMGLCTDLTENDVPEEERKAEFQKMFFNGEQEAIIVVDHQGSLEDSSLIDKMKQLASMGCQYILLDHITIAVSEGNNGLTGNEATDKMMSDLLKLVKGYDVWLGLISHLRKTGQGSKSFEEGHMATMDDIKGSGSIKQISFDIIAFARDMTSESEQEKNTVRFSVLKARRTGKTGPAGAAYYNDKTKRLRKIEMGSNIAIDNMFEDYGTDPKDIGL